MDNKEIRALHDGFVQKRTWHRVRWISGKHIGKFDVFTDEDLEENKAFVDVIETFKTDMCTSGPSYAFGITSEEKILEWIKGNKR